MGKFVKAIKITRDFEGDTITVTARPMDRATALKLRALRTEAHQGQEKGERVEEVDGVDDAKTPLTKEEKEFHAKLGAFMSEAFEEHIEGVEGARDVDGNALDKTTVLRAAFFMTLLLDMTFEWAKRSSPGN